MLIVLLTACAATGPGGGSPGDQTAAKNLPKVDPKITAAYESALSAMRDGKTAQAESALRQLVEKHPTFSGPRANLGILYFHANKLDQAKSAGWSAAGARPMDHMMIGLCCCAWNAKAVNRLI